MAPMSFCAKSVHPGARERALLSFLNQVRRRTMLAAFLAGAFFATGINEFFRWGSIAIIQLTRWRLPVLDVGPVFLVILIPYLRHRWNRPTTARRADSRLGFRDRLASFVDFLGREDIPDEVKAAQAAETARALGEKRAAAAAPVAGWLYAGPLLLLVSLAYPYFFFGRNTTLTVQMFRQMGGGGGQDGAGGESERLPAHGDNSGQQDDVAGGGNDTKTDPGARAQRSLPEESAQPETAKQGSGEAGPLPGMPAPNPTSSPPERHLEGKEPARLVSERVGRNLARVVDPLYTPGPAPGVAPAVPTGTVAFNLVPKALRSGERDFPGGAGAPQQVTVDLDALPEQYRSLVKTYFELLAGEGRPAAGGTTISTEERTR